MAKESKAARTAREEAAAARAAAIEKQRKRQRTINFAIAGAIAVVVIGIIGGAVLMSQQTKQQSGAVADPSAPVPTGVYGADGGAGGDYAFGVPFGSNPDAPVVSVWEDLQCPACGAFEKAMGDTLKAKAEAGEIYLVTRPTTFLDKSFNTDASRRATAAYGCAIDAGKGYEYKETVYANQPEREGDGWTDEQLKGFAQEVGIADAAYTTFEKCFTDRTYVPWSKNSTDEFYAAGVNGTPTVKINGETVETSDVVDAAKFDELIKQAAAKQ